MTRSELIEVLSFVPGFTTDMLTSLSSERLVELYSDYFQEMIMNELLNTIFLHIGLGALGGLFGGAIMLLIFKIKAGMILKGIKNER